MDFYNRTLWILEVFGIEIWITQTIFNTWMIMLVLILTAIIIRVLMSRWKQIPQGFQSAVETIVESFDNMVTSAAGEKFMSLGNWFFTVFVFLLVANLSGIIGMRPPTADWATTFAFALATFFIIQFVGIRHRRGNYLKTFIEPHFLFFPLNLIGELARPISLSFRLFGNVLAGMILITLVYAMIPLALRFVLPVALHAYFDLFSGLLQTYIFCVLSLTFIGSAGTSPDDG